MPEAVSDTDRLAALGTLSGAGPQSFHCDSPEPGNSGVTAYDEDQDIYILWNSFLAMIVLEELLADREEATKLLRSCWNPSSGCSDAEWDLLEPSAWELLVHREFEARGVKEFEVVRVLIQKTKTVVVDSRTSHAGSPWKTSCGRNRLYRGHFYGFRQLAPSWCGSEVLGKRTRIAVRCRWELNPGKSSIQDGSYGCRWMGSRCRQRAP